MKMVTPFPNQILRFAFYLLYHQLSWTYDWVAALASAGKWKEWVFAVLPYLNGPRVLELGVGPGHLQVRLAQAGMESYGIDESSQMIRQALGRLRKLDRSVGENGYAHYPSLCRALAQSLPFQHASFNSIVVTFPSLYIFDLNTLSEIKRVLAPEGRLVIILAAQNTGPSLAERVSSFLVKVTGQSPEWYSRLAEPFLQAGLVPQVSYVDLFSSQILLIQATKSANFASIPPL